MDSNTCCRQRVSLVDIYLHTTRNALFCTVLRVLLFEAGQNVSLPDASRPMDALYPTPPALSPRGLEAGAE